KVKGEDSLKWDILHDRAMIALQGPAAAGALQPLIADAANVDTDLSTLVFGTSRSLNLTLPDGTSPQILISRTGYTGEDGFELSIPTTPDATLPTRVVTALLATPSGAVKLAGLAARDSLRLEAGMCLYGNDITTKQTPPTASLGWLVGKDRRDPSSPLANFNGASVILPQLASPAKTLTERRVGLVVQEAGPAARAGTPLVDLADGVTQIGTVTSGLPSPSLGGKNIAMAYVKQGLHKKGTEVGVLLRKKVRRATVTAMPFVPNKFYRG
ncbi:Aminomethyltransferase, mitochondrial, partial [Ascosphaera atra]